MYTNNFYTEGFNSAKARVNELIDPLDLKTFNTPPKKGSWCVGEVLSHLIKTGNQYVSVLESKLLKGTAGLAKGSGPYTHPVHLKWFIKVVSPEFNPKIPTFPVFEPISIKELDKQELLKGFNSIQDRFINVIKTAETENLDLGKIKVGNPVFPILKMSISSCLAINEAHQRRHFEQIKRAIAAQRET